MGKPAKLPQWALDVEERRNAMERAVEKAVGELKPGTRLGFQGCPPIHGADSDERPGKLSKPRRQWTHPLDLMFAKKQLAPKLWLAGVRFRSDWELSHVTAEQTVNWDHLINSVHATDRTKAISGWGRTMPRQPFVFNEVQPHIVDARAVLEDMAKETSKVGFSLLIGVCGKGLSIQQIADKTGDDRRYLGRRFQEALEEAHDFYSSRIEAREK